MISILYGQPLLKLNLSCDQKKPLLVIFDLDVKRASWIDLCFQDGCAVTPKCAYDIQLWTQIVENYTEWQRSSHRTRAERRGGDERERPSNISCTCKPSLRMAEDSWNAGNLFISGRILRTRQALISGQVVRPWLGGCRRGRGSFFMTPLPKAFRHQQPFEDPLKAVEKLLWQQTHQHHICGAVALSSAAASLSIPSNFWGMLLLRPYQRRLQIWNVTEGNLKYSLCVLWTKHHSAEMSLDAWAFPLVLNVHHYFI